MDLWFCGHLVGRWRGWGNTTCSGCIFRIWVHPLSDVAGFPSLSVSIQHGVRTDKYFETRKSKDLGTRALCYDRICK
jgi:hypothetical protein